jgi:sulfate adenylyltransferase subunit 1 (EFTu-like GTPase family)
MLEELSAVAGAQGDDPAFAAVLDRFAEERRDLMTIDTAQTFLRSGGRHYVLIDAPGHKEFVRHMITGAAQADAALLVVAANQGLCEQTRRHASLLALLGVRDVIVAVNKMDAVLYSRPIFEAIREEAARCLGRLGLRVRAMIPISAQRGENLLRRSEQMPWCESPPLMDVLNGLEVPRTAGGSPLALSVQDVLERGGRAVALGRVESGEVSVGDSVLLQPRGVAETVASLETFRGAVRSAGQGWSVAVAFAGGSRPGRGSIVARVGAAFPVASRRRAKLFWMSERPWSAAEELEIRCADQTSACRLVEVRRRLDSSTLAEIRDGSGAAAFTEIVEAELDLNPPLVSVPFRELPELGRFVLSRNGVACAGGVFEE